MEDGWEGNYLRFIRTKFPSIKYAKSQHLLYNFPKDYLIECDYFKY